MNSFDFSTTETAAHSAAFGLVVNSNARVNACTCSKRRNGYGRMVKDVGAKAQHQKQGVFEGVVAPLRNETVRPVRNVIANVR